MDKSEKEAKRDISDRLELSDKTLWSSLTQSERGAVVNRYYGSNGIERVGLDKVLDDNREIRRGLGYTGLGTLLGLFGGAASTILMKYVPDSKALEAFIVLAFVAFLVWFTRTINKMSVDGLRQERVLEHIVKELKQRP
jgi:hypothetical protein